MPPTTDALSAGSAPGKRGRRRGRLPARLAPSLLALARLLHMPLWARLGLRLNFTTPELLERFRRLRPTPPSHMVWLQRPLAALAPSKEAALGTLCRQGGAHGARGGRHGPDTPSSPQIWTTTTTRTTRTTTTTRRTAAAAAAATRATRWTTSSRAGRPPNAQHARGAAARRKTTAQWRGPTGVRRRLTTTASRQRRGSSRGRARARPRQTARRPSRTATRRVAAAVRSVPRPWRRQPPRRPRTSCIAFTAAAA